MTTSNRPTDSDLAALNAAYLRTIGKFARDDEVGFRCAVPAVVSSFRVLEVMGYSPAGFGSYAYAYALSKDGDRFCTHRIIAQDDVKPDGTVHWVMESGNYCFITRQDAARDLVIRAYPGVSFIH